jgi:hypothetical protein
MRVAVFVCLLSACSNKQIDLEGKLVEITPDALVVDLKTRPGVRVDFGMTVARNGGVLVPADGTVRLSYPRTKWKFYSSDKLEIAAGKRSFGHETWGSAKVDTPALISSYLRIEKDDSGLWFGALRIGAKTAEGIPFDLNGETSGAWLDVRSKKLALVAAAPIGSEVMIGGETLEAKKPGVAQGDIPVRELALGTTLSEGEKLSSKMNVIVKKGDDSAKFAIELVATSSASVEHLRTLVAAELEAVEKGTNFPARPSIIEAVVVRTPEGRALQLGKAGPVGDARLIALEKATRREGEHCLYTSFSKTIRYDDIDVRIVEARTGKQLASKKFIAPYASCPQIAGSDDSFVHQVDDEKINAWIEKAALGKP